MKDKEQKEALQLGMSIEGVKPYHVEEAHSLEERLNYHLVNEQIKGMLSDKPKELRMKDMEEAAKRFEVYKPFIAMLEEAYKNETALYHSMPIVIALAPIDVYMNEHGLLEATEEEVKAHKKDFLAFFAAFLSAWKPGDNWKTAKVYIWEVLRGQGLIQGEAGEAIVETALAALQGFSYSLQGPLTAAFAMTRATPKKPGLAKIDELTGTAQIERGQFILTINNFTELRRGLDDTAQMLLDALVIRLTGSPPQNGIIELPLQDYMNMRGLKDEKEARKQVKEGLEALQRCTVQGFRGYGKNKGDYLKVTLYGGAGVYGIKNSVIVFSISPIYYETLLGYKAMPRPDRLLTIDTSRHKHAYALGTYIYWQKYINAGKPRENVMTVKALLAACPNLPRYEELDKSKGEISRKIIEPFRNNLNVLEDMGFFTWTFCHSKGEPLTPEEEEQDKQGGMPYRLFETLRIQFTFKDYPSQDKRIAAKKKYIAASKRADLKAMEKKRQKVTEKKLGL